jgi:hypothetical protein
MIIDAPETASEAGIADASTLWLDTGEHATVVYRMAGCR